MNTSIGFHKLADVTKTWCLKDFGESEGSDDLCIREGATRFSFGPSQESFAAAVLDLLSKTVVDNTNADAIKGVWLGATHSDPSYFWDGTTDLVNQTRLRVATAIGSKNYFNYTENLVCVFKCAFFYLISV